MKKPLLFAIILLSARLSAQEASLPPVFNGPQFETLQRDHRARVYLPPQKIVWSSQAGVSGAENLFRAGDGQSTTASVPQCVMRSSDGEQGSILLDFGREIQGGLQLVTGGVEGNRPIRVRVRLGESVSETMSDVGGPGGATNDHAMRDFIIELPWLGVCETGNSGFRFARIDLLDEDRNLPLKEVRAIFTYRDIPYLGSFSSSDPRLDSIWMTGAYTVHLNMQEYLWDGIKRDRLVWLGDMHPELRTINAVFGDNEVIRRSLDLARDETPLPGWMNGMCSYSLWWVLIHRDYYMYGGDREYLMQQKDYMSRLLTILEKTVGEDGRERLRGGGRFLDWPTSQNTPAIDAGLHALMLMTMEAGAYMCAEMGDETLSAKCAAAAERMRGVVPDYTASKQSAALIAMAGIVPAGEADSKVLSVGGVKDFSTFYGYYMLQAKALAGNYAEAMDNISEYWGGMLDLGATSFWEDFDIEWKRNGARIDQIIPEGMVDVHAAYGGYCYVGLRHSLCHGWASGPTAWLSEHVLGIKIVEPGCRVVKIEPNLGDLGWAEGSFPTPYGVIKVRHERLSDGSVRSKIDAPKRIKILK